MMIRVRNAVAVLAVLFAFPVMAGTANAHVEISPAKALAGKPVKLAFRIGHGCDGAATTSLVVQIPQSVKDVSPGSIKGWKARVGPQRLTWTGGPLSDHDEQEYPFRATFYGKKGDTVMFKSIQKCEGGAETAWIAPTGGASEADNPAPTVTLTSAAAVPAPEAQAEDDQVANEDAASTGEPTATAADSEDSSSDADGGSAKSLLLIIVAGLAIGTIAGIIVRGRRRQ